MARTGTPLPQLTCPTCPHSLKTTKDAAGRALNSLRKGLPKVSGKDFETFASLNMARS